MTPSSPPEPDGPAELSWWEHQAVTDAAVEQVFRLLRKREALEESAPSSDVVADATEQVHRLVRRRAASPVS